MNTPDNHELAIAVNTLTMEVKALSDKQREQNIAISELTATLQKGKGAVWLLTALGTITAFIITDIKSFFK